jgi:hypothetical protein
MKAARDVHAQRKDYVRTQQEGDHLKSNKRGFRTNQHLAHDQVASRNVRKKECC